MFLTHPTADNWRGEPSSMWARDRGGEFGGVSSERLFLLLLLLLNYIYYIFKWETFWWWWWWWLWWWWHFVSLTSIWWIFKWEIVRAFLWWWWWWWWWRLFVQHQQCTSSEWVFSCQWLHLFNHKYSKERYWNTKLPIFQCNVFDVIHISSKTLPVDNSCGGLHDDVSIQPGRRNVRCRIRTSRREKQKIMPILLFAT